MQGSLKTLGPLRFKQVRRTPQESLFNSLLQQHHYLGYPNVNIAALCDVDEAYAANTVKQFPGRSFYRDYRVMLEEERGLDAVVIGTPDHWHAPISIEAMRLGKHVYCEKPLAHTIEESRRMGEVAAEMGVVTQMGSGSSGMRRP